MSPKGHLSQTLDTIKKPETLIEENWKPRVAGNAGISYNLYGQGSFLLFSRALRTKYEYLRLAHGSWGAMDHT
jgi:hypothetical protein